MIRLALVGFGRWGRNYVRAANDSGNARVTHVMLREGSPSRADAMAAGLAVSDRLDGVDVDAAVVAIHPRLSPWVCQAVMRAGLPVMIEKPASLSLEDALELEASEREHGRLVLVSHQHLFSEHYERLRDLGPPDVAVARFTGPVRRDYSDRWDYGAHAVSCLLGLGAVVDRFAAGIDADRSAMVDVSHGSRLYTYDGYAPQELPLTRAVRAFASAVAQGGTDDYRFGAKWAVNVSKVLESSSNSTLIR